MTKAVTNQSPAPSNLPQLETSLQAIDLINILLRRKHLIIASAFFGLLAGASYFLLTQPSYESRAQVLVMQNDGVLSEVRGGNSRDSVSEDLLATHMSMLQSKRIVEAALRRESLDQLPSIVSKLDKDKSAADYVLDNLKVSRGGEGAARNARVLSVVFRHTDAQDCQRVTAVILDEYREFVAEKFRDVNEEAVGLIDRARLELESDIEKLSNDYREFRNNVPLLSATEGGANVYAMQYETLSKELSTLTIDIDESRGRLSLVKDQLKRLEDDDAHQIEKLALIDEQNAARLGILVTVERGESQTAAFQALQPERIAGATSEYTSLLTLKSQLAHAMQEHGPKHPAVTKLESQIKEMDAFLRDREGVLGVSDEAALLTPDDVMGAYVRLLENDLTGLEMRRAELVKQIAWVEGKAKELVDYELEDEQRIREMARSEELYDSIVSRLKDINMQKDASGLIQEVIEEPEVGKKVAPKAVLAAAIAVFVATLLSGLSLTLSELTDRKVHSAREFEGIYQAKVISHLPDLDDDRDARSSLRKIAAGNPQVSPYVICLHDRKSRVSEAFRAIRTQLLLKLNLEQKVVAISSPNPGDGKSTVSANLAVSLAQSGKSVLLIDCDLRRPAVHAIFGLSNEVGLSNVLTEEVDFQDAFQGGVTENLSLLTAGPSPESPAELLCSDRFRGLLEVLKHKFDVVLLDCPPMLAVTDPTIVASLVDNVLLVTTCLDVRGQPKARQCSRILESCGASVAGIIVNRTSKNDTSYDHENYDSDYAEYLEYA